MTRNERVIFDGRWPGGPYGNGIASTVTPSAPLAEKKAELRDEEFVAQEMKERRASRRYVLSVPVEVRTPSLRSRIGRTQDVSPDGLQLIMQKDDETLLPGAELDFALTLSTEMTCGFEVKVRARGRAVRIRQHCNQDEEFMEIAAVIDSYDFLHSTSLPNL